MPTPSQEVQTIVARLHDAVTLQEMDKHVSSLTRDLARYKNAFTELLDHAAGLNREIERLKQKIEELTIPPSTDTPTPPAE